jgi:hypothetical protein
MARSRRSLYGVWPMARSPLAHSMAPQPYTIPHTPSAISQLLFQRPFERIDLFTQRFSFFFDCLQFLLRNVRLLFGNEETRDSFKSGTESDI